MPRALFAILLLFAPAAIAVPRDPPVQFDTLRRHTALQERALRAVDELATGRWSAADLDALGDDALRMGYENIPLVSHRLLDLAARLVSGSDERKQLIERAVFLSPTDARTLIRAGTQIRTVGITAAAGYLWRGGLRFAATPSLVGMLVADGLLISATSATIFCIFAVVGLVIRHRTQLLQMFAFYFPSAVRGFAGPVVFVSILFLPLGCGLLVPVIVLSIALSRLHTRYRMCPFIVGGIILSWPLVLSVSLKVRDNARQSVQQMIEEVNGNSFILEPKKLVAYAQVGRPEDLQARLVAASILFREGLNARAGDEYRAVLLVPRDGLLVRTVLMNLGILHLIEGRHTDAESNFMQAQSLGEQSFTLSYRLAQVSLALTKPSDHDRYFAVADRQNREALRRIMALEGEEPVRLVASLPVRSLYARLLGSFGLEVGEARTIRLTTEARILGALIPQGDPPMFFLIGALLVLIAGFQQPARLRALRAASHTLPPPYFAGLCPGGWETAHGSVFRGCLVGTLFLTALCIALEMPLSVQALHEVSLPPQVIFGTVVVFMLIGAVSSAVRRMADG